MGAVGTEEGRIQRSTDKLGKKPGKKDAVQ